MTSAIYSFEKPFKVWSTDRIVRKSVVAGSLLELKLRAKEKLGYEKENVSELKVVLEVDGTEVEDDSFFQTAEENTIFLILRPEESWLPLGVEALKAALSAIPGLVTDALNKLDASDKLPSWKISDDQGVVTVTLSWDTRDRPPGEPLLDGENNNEWCLISSDQQMDSAPEKPLPKPPGVPVSSSPFLVGPHFEPSIPSGDQISSIPQETSAQTAAATRAKLSLEGLGVRPSHPRHVPVIQHSFLDTSEVHLEYSDSDEDVEDDGEGIFPCDFHCSGLHPELKPPRKLSVATSPISHPPLLETFVVPAMSTTRDTSKSKSGKYVRFQEVESVKVDTGSDSETETETTEKEDEQLNYLILVDQQRGLSIKDVGTILERLKGTILDVDKLEREMTDMKEYHWTIRALTRGKFRDVGVIHNGIFYGIGEHPSYF